MLTEVFLLLLARKEFFGNLFIDHLRISLTAGAIAVVLGMLTGILISEYRRFAKLTLGAVNWLYTIPAISLLGFLIPVTGIGDTTAIIALSLYALLPMVRSTYTGIVGIDARLVEAAEGMGSTRLQLLRRIKLPLAMPVVMAAIRNMLTMTIALAGIASFIGAGGLGVAIYRGITTNNAAMTLAGSLLIALLAIAADVVLGVAEARIARRRSGNSRRVAPQPAVALVLSAGLILAVFSHVDSRPTINIATKPMTEQYIIGEMLALLIEQDTGLRVRLTQGVGGGTSNIHPGMLAGDFDIYPEYTGTAWNMVLKENSQYDESSFPALAAAYRQQLQLAWVGMYGFNNTYGLAVRKELADRYQLKTYSDLAAVSDQLIFGAEYDFFEREDGYAPLCRAYGFRFKATADLDIGLKYQAINQGKIDVMNIFTTDGQLSAAQVVVLRDDKQFYPSYRCGNVIRSQTAAAHPQLKRTLESLTGLISDEMMAKMNYQVEVQAREPKAVAGSFLRGAGLLR
ncbi:MAG: glycine betaine ABC transporter substrate-binding protein [Sporomusaceae bacterium]|nr:glycine betaine ABC transporter substrate-binding protein [Sporomusaceae bacterium]